MLTRHQQVGYGAPRLRATVAVSNTDRCLIDALVERIGCGQVYTHKRQSKEHQKKVAYTWRLNAEQIREILPQTLPWLVCKRRQAELLIEALAIKRTQAPTVGRQSTGGTAERQRLDAIANEISRLNRKGRVAL